MILRVIAPCPPRCRTLSRRAAGGLISSLPHGPEGTWSCGRACGVMGRARRIGRARRTGGMDRTGDRTRAATRERSTRVTVASGRDGLDTVAYRTPLDALFEKIASSSKAAVTRALGNTCAALAAPTERYDSLSELRTRTGATRCALKGRDGGDVVWFELADPWRSWYRRAARGAHQTTAPRSGPGRGEDEPGGDTRGSERHRIGAHAELAVRTAGGSHSAGP